MHCPLYPGRKKPLRLMGLRADVGTVDNRMLFVSRQKLNPDSLGVQSIV
jgi:hypothetical protein